MANKLISYYYIYKKYLKYILFLQVQEIEKARILAEEKAQEVQTKENEARQLEQELREANIRVSSREIFYSRILIFLIFRFFKLNNELIIIIIQINPKNIDILLMMMKVMKKKTVPVVMDEVIKISKSNLIFF